jgi:hypothetical protein
MSPFTAFRGKGAMKALHRRMSIPPYPGGTLLPNGE